MKKTGIVILVLIALLLLLPAVFGLFTRDQVEERVSEINEAGLLDIQLSDYRRGWFSSTARLMVGAPESATPFTPDATSGDPAEIAMARMHALLAEPVAVVVTITHGPLPRSQGIHLGSSAIHATTDANDPRVAARMAALDAPWLFEFHARTSFGGTVRFDAAIPPVDTTYQGVLIRFSLRMEMTNLHMATWAQLLAETQQLSASATPEAVFATRLQPLLRDLLAEGPTLTVAPLTFVVNGDSVLLNLHFAVDPERVPDNLMAGVDDPMTFLNMFEVEAYATIAKVLLEELAANVARTQILAAQSAGRPINEDEIDAMAAAQANLILLVLATQGLINEAGDNYATAMTIRNGTLTVNGTELPLSMLEAALP